MSESVTYLERYSVAIRSSNLRHDANTTRADVDVIGAMGLAAKVTPLSAALTRLLLGDGHAVNDVVQILADKAQGAHTGLPRGHAERIAEQAIAWCRYPTCPVCGGHGYAQVQGAPALSTTECKPCKGTGQRLFRIRRDHQAIGEWMVAVIEYDIAEAGSNAMSKLAPRLDF